MGGKLDTQAAVSCACAFGNVGRVDYWSCLDEDGLWERALDHGEGLEFWVMIYSTIEAWAFWHLAISLTNPFLRPSSRR
jgi:hypothetical protein